jgi:hypothetical protein
MKQGEEAEDENPWQALVNFLECLACQKAITDDTFQSMRNNLELVKPNSSVDAVSTLGFHYESEMEEDE